MNALCAGINKGIKAIRMINPFLSNIIDVVGEFELSQNGNHFACLVRIFIGQLSVKSARE